MITNEKFWRFEKNIPILLYGENDFAKYTFSFLKQSGYDVRGILDLRYDVSCKDGNVLRLALKDLENYEHLKECIVIICLKNGRIHQKVADSLFDIGIRKIIYLPMKICNSLRYQEKHRRVYQSIQAFEYEKVGWVPYFSVEEDPTIIIERQDKRISFWCPEEYIHSATVEMINEYVTEELKEAKSKLAAYADVAIKCHTPYIELFKFLRGGAEGNVNLYLETQGRMTEQEREKLLLDRKELYKIYEQALHFNMGFFLDSPAQCKWSVQNGVFNVIDGMHRIQYLYSKGYREMPIIVSAEEYEQFLKCWRNKA